MAKQTINIPDLGGAESVDVIEVCVAKGDKVSPEDALIVLESDKASMDVPSPVGGKVLGILIDVGDTVSEGDAYIEIDVEGSGDEGNSKEAQKSEGSSADSQASEGASSKANGVDQEASSSPDKKNAGGTTSMEIKVPDIGGAEDVDVIELCVAEGDEIAEGDSLIVLESDKASMDIPSTHSGKIVSIAVSEGEKVSQGDVIVTMTVHGSTSAASDSTDTSSTETQTSPSSNSSSSNQSTDSQSSEQQSSEQQSSESSAGEQASSQQVVKVPDIGGAEDVSVIEISVAAGDEIAEGDSIVVLESDKASMEVPSPASGKVVSISISEGAKVSEGAEIMVLEVKGAPREANSEAKSKEQESESSKASPSQSHPKRSNELHPQPITKSENAVYAGPAVRKLARQLGVELQNVKATGPKSRMSKDDVRNYVKKALSKGGSSSGASATTGSGIPPIPEVDFSQFGKIELQKMSKIKKVTAANMSRAWLNVPHVTQFDDADITELEEFRKSMKAEAEKKGVKLTPLPFLVKAASMALKEEPNFNVSMHHDGEHIVQKNYYHIGMAVATPAGLMVPVIRDVDQKGIFDLAEEITVLAKKARDGKLMPRDMQGGCFTISSLGAIGGNGFTPIVNAPEVAILGVSRADIKPVWDGSAFVPRQMLPLCLSYDHRAINGADAGRFLTYYVSVLSDLRRMLL